MNNARQKAEGWFLGHIANVCDLTEQQTLIETAISHGVYSGLFSSPSLPKIWEGMQEAYERGLLACLENIPMFFSNEEMGGGQLATSLAEISINAPIVQCPKFLLRTFLGEVAKDVVDLKALELRSNLRGKGNVGPEVVAEEANSAFGASLMVGGSFTMRRTMGASELALEALNRQLEAEQNLGSLQDDFVTTGLGGLDDALGMGWKRGSLYIVGARPGVGKTMLSLQMALRAAQAGKRVLYFSMEMDAHELTERLISRMAAIDSQVLLKKQMNADESGRYYEACEELRSLPMQINDSAMPDLEKIFRTVMAAMATHDVDIIFVDYIQQLKLSGRWQNRVHELTDISGRLKKFALEHKIVVVACAQLNRGADKDVERIPRKVDLKDCGSLEQDADGVILIHRPSVKNPRSQDAINLDKNRRGSEELLPIWVDARIGLITTSKSNK